MKKIAFVSLLLASVAPVAFASDSSDPKAGDVMIRARALGVIPQENSHVSGGATVDINNSVVPELDASYFFTPNVAVEAIAALSPHHVRTAGGTNVGHAWLLPPTVTLQYHYNDLHDIKPYVGAGINYTHFFETTGGALGSADYKDSWGAAFQVGADIPLGNKFYANVDVKKMFVSTDVKFGAGPTAKVDIDPWLVGVGVGYRF